MRHVASDARGRALWTGLAAAIVVAVVLAPRALGHAFHPGASEPITEAPGLVLRPLERYRRPVFVTGDGASPERLYVAEQAGRIRLRHREVLLERPFLDIADLVRARTDESERGLLSMTFARDYATSGLFYVAYTENDGDVRVDEMRRAPGDPNRATRRGRRKVLEIEHSRYPTHHGGQLAFGRDGYLYVSVGDGGGSGHDRDPLRSGQDLGTLLGKVLRIDPRRPSGRRGYSVPPGNPFAGPDKRRDEIWAYGLRNPWRFSFDRARGDLWLADVGATSREEVNFSGRRRRARGFNFGWSCFEGRRAISGCEAPGHRPPLFAYSHAGASCAITGGYVLRDRTIPRLYGRYVYGDYCTGAVHALTRTADGVGNRYLGLVVPRLTTFGEDTAGRVHLASWYGRVYRLEAARAEAPSGG